jgi:hypothetical protein
LVAFLEQIRDIDFKQKLYSMKTRNFFQKALIAVPVLAATLLLTSCDDDDDDFDDSTYTLSGNASGGQENPPVTTTATATLTGTYNKSNNRLDYTINWTGLSGPVTVAHFHGPAATGVNAPPMIDIAVTTNGVSGVASGNMTVHDSVETHLLAGKVYYNLHTAANVNGEIRAQVLTAAN